MPTQIRLSIPADIKSLQAIEVSASKAFLSVEGLHSFADDSCMNEAQHISAINEGTSWVAASPNGTLTGFLAALTEEDALHIYELSVHFDFQKLGIGRALMHHAENWANSNGLRQLTLTTFKHVSWNAPFYEKLGFRILSGNELGDRLSKTLEDEIALGLPEPENRCAMRKCLTWDSTT